MDQMDQMDQMDMAATAVLAETVEFYKQELARAQRWKDEVSFALANWGMVESDDPKESLNRLLDMEIKVALDPAVSAEAEKLRDTYKQATPP